MNIPPNNAGIAAAWHIDQAASTVYYLLHGLQHRGSDGAGIAAANGEQVSLVKRTGMLAESIKPALLETLQGNLALGQVGVAARKDHREENLQPVMVRAHQGSFAIACTGSVLNAPSLRKRMEHEGLIFQGTSDAEIIAHLIQVSEGKMKDKIETACQMLKGAYTIIVMTKNTMYALTSKLAIHSLYYAKAQDGYLIASETSAFALFDAHDVHRIAPGQMIILGKEGFETRQMDWGVRHFCAMEPVYYSREDSLFDHQSVYKVRQALGQALARDETTEADLVIGVPDTANAAAAAFANALGLPNEIGLIKNRYLGSTFSKSAKEQRDEGMKVRLNAISSIVSGKRIFVIDDSIQKGKTARYLCRMLREAGAKEIHLRIGCAPIKHPCVYGTEYIPKKDLSAAHYTAQELADLFGADSLRFLPLADFKALMPQNACTACMSGNYPSELYDYRECDLGKDEHHG